MSNNKINCIYFESGKSKGYTCHCLRDNSYRHNCPCKFFKPTLKERIHRKMWGGNSYDEKLYSCSRKNR